MASVDMKRFHATFFAESREGLDAMESGLLELENGGGSIDTIHTIFRAAHSIKGGSATFGFTAIAGLTHVLETLLDELRAEKRPLTADATDALLASVDVLRGLLDAAESDSVPADDGSAVKAQLETVLTGKPVAASAPIAAAKAVAAAPAAPKSWKVGFVPRPSLFMSGNDPLRIIRELAEFGEMKVQYDAATLPAFNDLDPTQAYLRWTLTLPGSTSEAAIKDVFAWVEDECDLTVQAEGAAAPTPVAAAVSESVTPAPAAATATAEPPKPAAAKAKTESNGQDADASIRVQASKIDALINLVGELVITQAMLKQISLGVDGQMAQRLQAGLETLERNTRDLQDAVISVRMLPVESVFSRFPRLVRDLSGKLGKKVRLKTSGEATELDKGLIEKIADPLVHLVRNSIDHGLETTEDRIKAGKDETGTITLSASHQGGHIVIEVADDGKGLNRDRILAKARERGLPVGDNPTDSQVWDLIFAPGFSTAEAVTDLSGRGVGMDVVRRNILSLGGEVQLESAAGKGTRVIIRLPLTLAIMDGMTVRVGEEILVLPLGNVIEALQPAADEIRSVNGQGRVLKVRGEYLPMIHLGRHFNLDGDSKPSLVVVVEGEGRKLAFEVEELVGQQQVVVKSLETNYRRIPGISGATILGDGRVSLIVDISAMARERHQLSKAA